jgi:hypothetical protein
MKREVALKIVLAAVGLLFLALAYPLIMFVRQDPRGTLQNRPMRDTSKPANGNRQDEFFIPGSGRRKQEKVRPARQS